MPDASSIAQSGSPSVSLDLLRDIWWAWDRSPAPSELNRGEGEDASGHDDVAAGYCREIS